MAGIYKEKEIIKKPLMLSLFMEQFMSYAICIEFDSIKKKKLDNQVKKSLNRPPFYQLCQRRLIILN